MGCIDILKMLLLYIFPCDILSDSLFITILYNIVIKIIFGTFFLFFFFLGGGGGGGSWIYDSYKQQRYIKHMTKNHGILPCISKLKGSWYEYTRCPRKYWWYRLGDKLPYSRPSSLRHCCLSFARSRFVHELTDVIMLLVISPYVCIKPMLYVTFKVEVCL